jgi:xanthine dehydrogenase accessory factor
LVSVVATRGSSPREAGTAMVVRPSGGFHGTIGGGALEWRALAEARELLRLGRGESRRGALALGPDLGQCCGGRVDWQIDVYDSSDLEDLESRDREEASRPRGAPLLLFGAGHVGRALSLALAPLPFAVRWIDSRPDAFPAYKPQGFELMLSADPPAELASAPDGALVVVMTHSHPLDLAIVSEALRQNRFRYVGVIGSATKRARFESLMRKSGIPDSALAKLVCPVGIPGIGGKEPAVIAASLAAQLLLAVESPLATGA